MPEQTNGQDAHSARNAGPEPKTIFISYRVDPDQPLAEAVKSLIEGSIEPAPNVFVSGAGGLRPSALGYRQQLQEAVHRAVAFIGIISSASKDRSWLHFEAGAAWGRKHLYAPLLIDLSPSDMDSTIIEYQATRADDYEAFRRLIEDLASIGGARVLGRRFGQRYGAFQRLLADYRAGKSIDEDTADDEDMDASTRAGRLLMAGKREEAEGVFREIESSGDASLQAVARVDRVAYEPKIKARDTLLRLEKLDEAAKATGTYALWHGIYEARHAVAVNDFRKALSLTLPSFARRVAAYQLTKCLRGLGRDVEALQFLCECLREPDRRMKAMAAACYVELWKDEISDAARLVLLSVGLSAYPDPGLWAEVHELYWRQRWRAMGVYLSRRYERDVTSGSSANTLGACLAHAELRSLAYEAYEKAVERGVSVAKVNMAKLLADHANAFAALKHLAAHEGAFDAAAHEYPHETRAALEEAVQSERQKADKLEAMGRQVFHMLVSVADEGIATSVGENVLIGTFRRDGRVVTISPDGNGARVVEAGSTAPATFLGGANQTVFRPVLPGVGLFEAEIGGEFSGLYIWKAGSGLHGVSFTAGSLENPTWDEWKVEVSGTSAV